MSIHPQLEVVKQHSHRLHGDHQFFQGIVRIQTSITRCILDGSCSVAGQIGLCNTSACGIFLSAVELCLS
eukprot:m.106424 g.106424  ORF g.106424 m.106424 type:complete len:70 (+) comp16899_c0_seq2:229-438(+)